MCLHESNSLCKNPELYFETSAICYAAMNICNNVLSTKRTKQFSVFKSTCSATKVQAAKIS